MSDVAVPAVVDADERQPLLVDPEYDAENPTGGAPPVKKRKWWVTGWQAILTLLGIGAIGLFIKGFIDADDVEVRIYLARHN